MKKAEDKHDLLNFLDAWNEAKFEQTAEYSIEPTDIPELAEALYKHFANQQPKPPLPELPEEWTACASIVRFEWR